MKSNLTQRHNFVALHTPLEIDRNLRNFRVKLGTSLVRSGGEEVKEEVQYEGNTGWVR